MKPNSGDCLHHDKEAASHGADIACGSKEPSSHAPFDVFAWRNAMHGVSPSENIERRLIRGSALPLALSEPALPLVRLGNRLSKGVEGKAKTTYLVDPLIPEVIIRIWYET